MKIVKSIILFLFLSVLLVGSGVVLGIKLNDRYYGEEEKVPLTELAETGENTNIANEDAEEELQHIAVSGDGQKINADTVLVVMEKDILQNIIVETERDFPAKYLGMNRKSFETAMEVYEKAPPLTEKERGFVGLEIQSFSEEKVVLQMNYEYVQPGSNFYLGVLDHEVVVFLEDMKTVYISTGIPLNSLPIELQMEIIGLKAIEDEESLYGFLENYSS